MTRIIGTTPLCGYYYPAECTQCGWVGSSEDTLGEDGDCPECQRETVMLNVMRAFELLQEQAGEILTPPAPTPSRAEEVIASLREQLGALIAAVGSINRGPAHAVLIEGDDQPCYWQRKGWIDYVLGLCADASPAARGFDPARPGSDQSCRMDARRLPDGTLLVESLTYGAGHD